jgi:hypothetical protein
MGDHAKALEILVHNVGDHEAAELYCDQISEGKEERVKQELMLNLLKAYLAAKPSENQSPTYYEELAKDLCNRRGMDFCPVELVGAVPQEWNATSVALAMRKALVKSKRDHRMARVHAEVAKGNYFNLQIENYLLNRSTMITITENE